MLLLTSQYLTYLFLLSRIMPPKNKSTKNQARSKRSCGPPLRFGDPITSNSSSSAQVAQESGEEQDTNPQHMAGSQNPHAHGLLTPHEQVMQGLATLTQLTQSQKMDLEKNSREQQRITSEFKQMQKRLSILERQQSIP